MKWFVVVAVTALAFSMVSAAATPTVTDIPQPGDGVMTFEARILSIDNSTLVISSEGEVAELLAKGTWLLITSEFAGKRGWNDVMEYLEEGEALVVVKPISYGNETFSALVGLKQGDVTLLRPALLKHHVKRHLFSRTYLSVRGEIVEKGANYLIIERNGVRGFVFVNGTWVKAGEGEVHWRDVSDEFRIGDIVRVFCHNILVMDDGFVETFGINGFIWGYSGAIMDLTSGTALSRI